MSYRPKPGETEFGGVAGMYPEQNLLAPDEPEQGTWAIYATNESGGLDPETGEDSSSVEWGREHIGEARVSYTPGRGSGG